MINIEQNALTIAIQAKRRKDFESVVEIDMLILTKFCML